MNLRGRITLRLLDLRDSLLELWRLIRRIWCRHRRVTTNANGDAMCERCGEDLQR